MKIIADNTVPYLRGIAEPFAETDYISSPEFTPERVKNADALIVRSIDKCTRGLLEGSGIRLITTATIGFDHIDTRYCKEAGIEWRNAPGCNAMSVAQYVLASMLRVALSKGEKLQGKTIGIVGAGHVGSHLERLCRTFGMRVLLNDPPRECREKSDRFVSLDTIASESDIVGFHTPLTREGEFATYHLAGASFFPKLKKNPWFVNASRGSVHDTEALVAAKKQGLVSELIIDCWENEPAIHGELLRLTSVATPHIAGFSADGKANGTRMCLEAIGSFFNQRIERLPLVVPPAPQQPVIDLNTFGRNRIAGAVFHSFDPLHIDGMLREHPGRFEWFRSHYDHPREFAAYTVRNATEKEAGLLAGLGFAVE